MIYQWQLDIYKSSAEDAGRLFKEIEKEHGEITPELVLDKARDDECPIHDDFEWRDDVAAEKYRLSQAQKMISMIVVVEDDTPPVRAFVNTNYREQKASYVDVSRVVDDKEKWQVVLRNARRELEIFDAKHRKYPMFAKIIAAHEKFLEETS